MGEHGPILLPSAADRNAVFEGFKDHSSGKRLSTEVTMFEHIRKAHPEFHISCTSPAHCDLIGYAKAGHAVATCDSDESFDASRVYMAPTPRREGGPGELKDNV